MSAEYYRGREAEARRLAAASENSAVQRVHTDMAVLYAARAELVAFGEKPTLFTDRAA